MEKAMHVLADHGDFVYPELKPVAYVKGCFPDKFGIPRQSSLSKHSDASLIFTKDFQDLDYVRGIQQYSHLWLIFGFHQNYQKEHHNEDSKTAEKERITRPFAPRYSALVRPQRLGGNAKLGVFATRSGFRPNGLGLSVVKLESIQTSPFALIISGHDLCDDTPIFDIKPYIPFNDMREATSEFADEEPPRFPVIFSAEAEHILFENAQKHPHLKLLIEELISQDPRPAYHSKETRQTNQTDQNQRIYGLRLYNFDIRFFVRIHSKLHHTSRPSSADCFNVNLLFGNGAVVDKVIEHERLAATKLEFIVIEIKSLAS